MLQPSIQVFKSLFILLLAALPISARGLSVTSDFFELYFSKYIQIQTLPVLGGAVDDIKLQLISGAGPKDQHGVHRYAVTKWNIKWRWPVNKKGEADFSRAKVNSEVKITIPTWELPTLNQIKGNELNRWQKLYINLLNHELDHAKTALDTSRTIQNELKKLSSRGITNPSMGNQISNRQIAKNRSWDREYDQKTAHGKNQHVD